MAWPGLPWPGPASYGPARPPMARPGLPWPSHIVSDFLLYNPSTGGRGVGRSRIRAPLLTGQAAEKKLKRMRTERSRELSPLSAHYFSETLHLYLHLSTST